MKILILILIGIVGFAGQLNAYDSALYNWTNGQPTPMENPTSTCYSQSTVIYNWSQGQPTAMYDSTKTCDSPPPPPPPSGNVIFNTDIILNTDIIIN